MCIPCVMCGACMGVGSDEQPSTVCPECGSKVQRSDIRCPECYTVLPGNLAARKANLANTGEEAAAQLRTKSFT